MLETEERKFWSEYRKVTPKVGDWVRLGGQAPVTYQEACEEISLEMKHDLEVGGDVTYEYRIINDAKVMVMRTSVPAVSVSVDSGAGALPASLAGMSEAEILRRWKIVDALIEEHDELVAAREAAKKATRGFINDGNWLMAESSMELMRRDRKREIELALILKAGDDA